MVIRKGGGKTVKGGALYDTVMVLCKGCVKTVKGGTLYDTAMIINKGVGGGNGNFTLYMLYLNIEQLQSSLHSPIY